MDRIKKFFNSYFSIHGDTASQDEIYNRLVNSAAIRGTNMCVLMLAILIASIGLNMNSTAVIIGAMLISPIMGSIMAISYGIASGDMNIVKKFSVGFLFQIIVSLLTSFIYFSITPINNSTSELLARTSPTIWDVLIAIFGGLAGIIGMTRKEKSNIIPGVAIATALMPPLCTAGYGLATHQWRYFLGAFYLFILNSYFICMSSIIVLLLLNVSKHTIKSGISRKTVIHKAAASTIIIIIPSIFLSINLVKESNITGFEEKASIELRTLGEDAQILFPEITDISIGDTLSYSEDEVTSKAKITVTTDEEMNHENQEILKKWLEMHYENVDEIEIVMREE